MAGDSTLKGGWHRGRFAHTFGAIDLGTNNCRLLVARASVSGFEVIDAYSRPVRLGEGMALSGTLCGEAIDRTLGALEVCAAKIARNRVTRARHIATEACRRACNGSDFLGLVEERTGLKLEVIAPAEEARLALASCEDLLDPEIPLRPAGRYRRRLDRGELDRRQPPRRPLRRRRHRADRHDVGAVGRRHADRVRASRVIRASNRWRAPATTR